MGGLILATVIFLAVVFIDRTRKKDKNKSLDDE